jgi:hypothetical protein
LFNESGIKPNAFLIVYIVVILMTRKNISLVLFVIIFCTPFMRRGIAGNVTVCDGEPSAYTRVFASSSVLSTGNWFKIAVGESGMCRVSYSMLQSMGAEMAQVNPSTIRVFGNGGGMLPENNDVYRHDDLVENAVYIVGGDDGSFDVTDYILFYATGPIIWKFNTTENLWEHQPNVYTDSSYYFISIGSNIPGKRVEVVPFSAGGHNTEVTSYDYRGYHDRDVTNLIKSGRSWYGEAFDIIDNHDFNFQVPEIEIGSSVVIRTATAARSTASSYFTCTAGNAAWQINHTPISTYYNSPYASGAVSYHDFEASGPVSLHMQYNKSTSTSIGWLDCIDLKVRSKLVFKGGQLDFRDLQSVGIDRISKFTLRNAAGKAAVWDVTRPFEPRLIETGTSGNDLVFTLPTDTLQEFIAFDVTEFLVPRFAGKVQNQNLHSYNDIDMVIIAPPVFMDQAVRLANFHASQDDLNTIVVTPEAIYNEFSSGAPDAIAIRDFMKMLYDRGEINDKLRYLLLFGDGSYDNKNRLPENTNLIPTWQTPESFDPVRSGVSDDCFGLLGDAEGSSNFDNVDIGIGRLPVKSPEEAVAIVDKILTYTEKSTDVMGDWRNIIAFVADDEDGNEHMIQADNMAGYLAENFGNFNIDKVYLDAYIQQTSSAGARYPDVNKAITQRVEKGCLILNYTGHGGETGWAHEQVLEVQDIEGWSNFQNMPVFVTATCEFSRFDDPGRTSAGEFVLLNPHGGGISLFTTTRPTYGSPNFELNKSLYEYAFETAADHRPMMGDIMREAKRESGSNENGRKFILLGDPAVAIAFPELSIKTISVNGQAIGHGPDTLKAYAEVTVKGKITDQSGLHVITDFNGIVYPAVYDKVEEQTTLGNDGGTPFSFSLQKSILYRGKVQADTGYFTFSFIVPKDIAYRYDYGKLSYYATDGIRDASGSYTNLIVGGSAEDAQSDIEGPAISLFMNDENFTDGGITDENPWLIAKVSDLSGINTIGSGIGHDITAVLDGKTDAPYILNDFYESDVNTFRSGVIHFPLSQLDPGEHSIDVKVWDIYNNSGEATIHFTVHNSSEVVLENPRNYPNPFREFTDIIFEHNQQGSRLDVNTDIYSYTGEWICTLKQSAVEQGVSSTPLRWDGRLAHGGYASSGIYFYRITATNDAGQASVCNGKLVLAR